MRARHRRQSATRRGATTDGDGDDDATTRDDDDDDDDDDDGDGRATRDATRAMREAEDDAAVARLRRRVPARDARDATRRRRRRRADDGDVRGDVARGVVDGRDARGRGASDARHLGGKKFARATARAAREADLKQYEPHIVPSAYRSGYVFCRLTGARVRASEEAVVRHASGRRFERAHAAAAAGRTTLLEEKDPVVEEAAREADREAQLARASANKAAKEARAEKMQMEKEAKRAEKARRLADASAKPAASTTRWGAGCRRVTFSTATTTTRAKTTTRTTRTRRTGRMI